MDLSVLDDTLFDILGKRIGASTIRKYVKEGLASEPSRHSFGRGIGRRAEYKEDALGEIYAARKLLSGPIQVTLEVLRPIRKWAEKLLKDDGLKVAESDLQELQIGGTDLAYIIELWLNYYEEGMAKANRQKAQVKYRVSIERGEKEHVHLTFGVKVPRTKSR